VMNRAHVTSELCVRCHIADTATDTDTVGNARVSFGLSNNTETVSLLV
jgi:hypothetical protein